MFIIMCIALIVCGSIFTYLDIKQKSDPFSIGFSIMFIILGILGIVMTLLFSHNIPKA